VDCYPGLPAIAATIVKVARLTDSGKDKTLKNYKRDKYTKFSTGVKIELTKYTA